MRFYRSSTPRILVFWMACGLLSISSTSVFSQELTTDEVNEVEDLVCENTPAEIRDEMVKDFRYLHIGSGLRSTSADGIASLVIVKNTANCRRGYCRAYVSYRAGKSSACVFEMATYIDQRLFINSDIMANGPIPYSNLCSFYYRGFCFTAD